MRNQCKSEIIRIQMRQVYSERRHPGVEAHVFTAGGAHASAICTAGVSVGTHEVAFSYDGGDKWGGKGVMRAVQEADEYLVPALLGEDAADQQAVDEILIDLRCQKKAGGNATAAISAAVLKAGAEALGIPLYRHIGGVRATTLPVPGIGILGGRRRYNDGTLTNKPSYSFLAYDFPTFSDASYALWELQQHWSRALMKRFQIKAARDGFSDILPGMLESDRTIWEMAAESICACGYEGKVGLQVDAASDSYYNKDTGIYCGLFNGEPRDRDAQIEFLLDMIQKYPFVCLEDPLYEDDYEGTALLTRQTDIQIVGDDLFTTNSQRVKEGIRTGAGNTVLLKVNQIGTISESLEMIQLAYENNMGVMPCSSRGEGIAICDYCVGINAGSVRESGLGIFGNRFLEIEAELGSKARFAGKHGLRGSRFAIH